MCLSSDNENEIHGDEKQVLLILIAKYLNKILAKQIPF